MTIPPKHATVQVPTWRAPATLMAAITFACLAAVAAALVSQHVYDMQPCPWCILQRVIFIAIAMAAVVGLVGLATTRVTALLLMVLADCGIAAALWQHFMAAKSSSCAMTVADKIVSGLKLDSLWPDVFLARASCADAAVQLAGMPYEFWSGALFFLIAVIGAYLLRWPIRAST